MTHFIENSKQVPLNYGLLDHPPMKQKEDLDDKIVYTVTLFSIINAWKQPKCPLTDEQVKKMWYT